MNPKCQSPVRACLNGHVMGSLSVSQSFPEVQGKFCEKCGEATIASCPECGGAILASYNVSLFSMSASAYELPAYCRGCGKQYPGTSRRLEAVAQLANEDGSLSTVEANLRDTLSMQVTAERLLKKLLPKLGLQAAQGVRDILVDVVSEAVRKALWPGG